MMEIFVQGDGTSTPPPRSTPATNKAGAAETQRPARSSSSHSYRPYSPSRPTSSASSRRPSLTGEAHGLNTSTGSALSYDDDDDELEVGQIANSLVEQTPRGPQHYQPTFQRPVSPSPAPRGRPRTPPPKPHQQILVDDVVMTDAAAPLEKKTFLAEPPLDMELCPHKIVEAMVLEPGSPVPAFQIGGEWEYPHIQLNRLLAGYNPDLIDAYTREPPADRVIVTLFLGGDFTTSRWYDGITDKIKNVLGSVVGFDEAAKFIVQRPPSKKNEKDIRDKYAGARSVIVNVKDKAMCDKIVGFHTLPIASDLAVHVMRIDPLMLTWVIGHFNSSVLSNDKSVIQSLRWLAAESITTGRTPGSILARQRIALATQHLGGPAESRILTVARSVFVRYVEAGTRSHFVLLMKPCTTHMNVWDDIRTPIRSQIYEDFETTFTPIGWQASRRNDIPHPFCLMCSLDTHRFEGCSFVQSAAWSGPRHLLSADSEGLLAQKEKPAGQNGGRGGNPRGGFRGGNRR
ncbi:hypothetical protein C8F01DRAFT_1266158 [Mycena amicta]|nr:hypothetical protein C8F01DRAFT_1266158 [Mycena amicta]